MIFFTLTLSGIESELTCNVNIDVGDVIAGIENFSGAEKSQHIASNIARQKESNFLGQGQQYLFES